MWPGYILPNTVAIFPNATLGFKPGFLKETKHLNKKVEKNERHTGTKQERQLNRYLHLYAYKVQYFLMLRCCIFIEIFND